jgi:hypothetical protein
MRGFILATILAVGAVMHYSTPSAAQRAFCNRGRACVPVTQATYNSCFQLALARGESVSWRERRRLEWFIYQCLAGRIPR